MEKTAENIECALGNDLLLHQVFQQLEQEIEEKLTKSGNSMNDRRQLVQLKFLWDKCGHSDYAVALQACNSTTALITRGFLPVEESLIALTASIATATHYGVLVDAVGSLLCQREGKGSDVRHPYITILEMEPSTWPYIEQQLNSLIDDYLFNKGSNKEAEVRFLVVYILCCGGHATRLSLWNLLMNKLYGSDSQQLVHLLLESLVWQQEKTLEQCSFQLTAVQQLCEYAMAADAGDLAAVASVLLASVLQPCHAKFGFSVERSVVLLRRLDAQFRLWVEPVVALVSQFLLNCHSNCYEPILQLGQQFVGRPCHRAVWSMLQSAALSLLGYAAAVGVEPAVLGLVESVPEPPSALPTAGVLHGNPFARYLSRGDARVQTALAAVDAAASWNETGPALREGPAGLSDAAFLLLCGRLWRRSEAGVLRRLVGHVEATGRRAHVLLALLLNQLTAPSTSKGDGRAKVAVLHALPRLAIDKTCVPRVLQILEALAAAQPLQPLRLRLLADLWTIQDRAYPFLEKVLLAPDRPAANDEFAMAKAAAIEIVCRFKPEKYGADLLSEISQLLNGSLGRLDDDDSATVASLALDGLIALCRAEVVDLRSVWDLLAPKLNQDPRALVATATCRLLALAPQLRVDSEPFELFVQQAIVVLFQLSFRTDQPQVAIEALRALSGFRREDFELRSMPHDCKSDLKIPSKYLPTKGDESTPPPSVEDVFDHVPGSCWTRLMDSYPDQVLDDGFSVLLARLIGLELAVMPAWIYKKAAMEAIRKNEPPNYNGCLKEDSVLAACVQYVLRLCEPDADVRRRVRLILAVLAAPLEKPLPPLDWTVLEPVVDRYGLRAEFLAVLLPQVPHSFSAQTVAERTLVSAESLDVAQVGVFVRHLDALTRGLKLKTALEFVERLFGRERQSDEWALIFEDLKSTLETEQLAPELRQAIAGHVTPLLGLVSDERLVESYARCFQLVDDGATPPDPAPPLARKYVVVFCRAADQCPEGSRRALSFLQRALQTTVHVRGLDADLVEVLRRRLQLHCPPSKTSAEFLQQFMSFVQLVALKPRHQHQDLSNLLNVFCLLVTVLSQSTVLCDWPAPADGCWNAAWNRLPLAVHRLVHHAEFSHVKKSLLDWTLVVMEQPHANCAQAKGALFDALPALDAGADKTALVRVITF